MIYLIMATYRGEKELVDTCNTIEVAMFLKKEYQLAFGSEWSVYIRREETAGVNKLLDTAKTVDTQLSAVLGS